MQVPKCRTTPKKKKNHILTKMLSALSAVALLGCVEPAPKQEPIPTEPIQSLVEKPAAPTNESPIRYVTTPSGAYIRSDKSSKSAIFGQTMQRARLPVFEEAIAPSSGCKSEKWLRVQYGGWLCSDLTKEAEPADETEMNLENKTPHQNAQLTKESDLLSTPGGKPLVTHDKGKILPILRIVTVNGKDYAQVEGSAESTGGYIAAEDLKFLGKGSYRSSLKGEVFGPEDTFPFVIFTEDTPLAQTAGGPVPKINKDKKIDGAHKKRFERTSVLEQQELDGKTYYRVDGGWFQKSTRAAIIEKEKTPEGVKEGSHWALVDLSDQTIVAYEGDTPIWASLTATGKSSNKGAFWTVTGSFRLQRKYRYKDMEGSPFGEHYLVEDVPWPQYFFEGYAIHGAFWHNRFGKVTSHGCVNLTPADAKWMADFLDPQLPPGWYAIFPNLEMETSVIVVRL